MIRKIYDVDPLTCPKCQGRIRIISFIENLELIKKILKHLDLWDLRARPPPKKGRDQPTDVLYEPDGDSQIPFCEDDLYRDPDYPIEMYAS